jgi:hypothetical protein
MPAPKSSRPSTRKSSASKAAGARRRKESPESTLQRFLDPREVVVVTRARLQEALDEAVERGRMTSSDAGDLLTELMRRGREDIESLLGTARKTVSGPADRVMREADRARRATGLGSAFPISGYDDLTAAKVTERLADLTPAELRKVRDYEKRNANRKSVLAAIEQKLK